MAISVLSVAYPLAAVGPDAVGGAEQVLQTLDAALTARGDCSLVVACEGSQVAGRLLATPAFPPPLTETVRSQAVAAQIEILRRHQGDVDLVHIHSLAFAPLLEHVRRPVLVTLHLPLSFYDGKALRTAPSGTWFNCVSKTQHAGVGHGIRLTAPIENGVDLDAFGGFRKRRFVLFLGRICPEKGVHLAIAAAHRAGSPLVIAGEVFGYEAHRAYFEEVVRPRLGRDVRFVGAVGGRAKRRLLTAARAVLVPSLADETSSLVAREAAASGTAVIAFRRGALPETVVPGETGFIVGDVDDMAAAISEADTIAPAVCRRHAERHFAAADMIKHYFEVYRRLT